LPHEAGLDELVWLAHATMAAKALAKQLGFAPVKLGKLNEGGALVHARGRIWGQLIFQDLFKKEQ
jgi:predicted dinucleotide-binding enzyme